jgi:predicted O-methyltransferase YrrM
MRPETFKKFQFRYWIGCSYIKACFAHLLNGMFGKVSSFQAIYDIGYAYFSHYRHLVAPEIPVIARKDLASQLAVKEVMLLGRMVFPWDYKISYGSTPMQSVENITSMGLLLNHYRPRRMLEIGTQAGLSAINWAMNNIELEKLVTLDVQDIVTHNPMTLKMFKLLNIEFVHTDSKRFREVWDQQKFDFIFIDGDHSYEGVKADSDLAFELIAPGGIIVWDDYRLRQYPGIHRHINQLARTYPIKNIEGSSLAYLEMP